jgi:hypothetical protein
MRVIQLAAKADPDGVLRLTIPVGAAGSEFEVAVIVSPRPATNGAPAGNPKTPEELGWPPGFFEQTFGSITDEAFKRYPQGEYEKREPLD